MFHELATVGVLKAHFLVTFVSIITVQLVPSFETSNLAL